MKWLKILVLKMAKIHRTLITEKNWEDGICLDASKADSMGRNESQKMVSKEGGLKYSKGKLEWSYFPFDAAKKIMEVIQYGHKKYEWNNWKKNPAKVYFDAGMRHLFAHLCGEKIDKDSGLTHLAMVNCNFLFALWVEECKNAEK